MAGPLDWIAGYAETIPEILAVASAPPRSLDQLRSDLSHETASRVAFLSAVAVEWRRGRFEAGDPARCAGVLADLQSAHRRYALLASSCGRAWRDLVAALASIHALVRACRRLTVSNAPSPTAIALFSAELSRLDEASARLVATLAAHHAVGLREIVEGAVADLRDDPGGRLAQPVGIEIETRDGLPSIWLPRDQAARWRDVLRNILRNAIQATRQQWPIADGDCPSVRIAMHTLPAARGVSIRIADLGVGMNAEQLAGLWIAGASQHGPGRGHGLTEAKREFVEARAGMQVVSEVGRGTTVTLDFSPHDIDVPALRPWRRPALQLGVLVMLLGASLTLPAFRGPATAISVDVVRGNTVRGLGPRGETLWEREVGARILGNDHLSELGIRNLAVFKQARSGRLREVLASSASGKGSPGQFCYLDGRGRITASRKVSWTAPRGEGPAELGSFWQAPVAWTGGPDGAYVVDVRKSNKAPESIQVVTARGEDFGAYHHPGQIRFFACEDFDSDGLEEFLVFGINNDAWQDSLLVECASWTWYPCAALLAPPPWHGQAYPYSSWDSLPAAREKAYLLIPPLDRSAIAQGGVAIVERASAPAPSSVRLLLRLQDGRIVETDGRLRPVRYYTGDVTPASILEAVGQLPALRVAYFHDGAVELIDVPRRGAHDE
jgi:signal transduction histidine kinase